MFIMCGFCREEQELFEEMMIEGLVGHDSELYLSVKKKKKIRREQSCDKWDMTPNGVPSYPVSPSPTNTFSTPPKLVPLFYS